MIYDTDGGILWPDADGTGAGTAIRLANISAGPALTAADVSVIRASVAPPRAGG